MLWSSPKQFTCQEPTCGKTFYSRTYNPHRCPDCRAEHIKKSHLANYHKRRAELIVQRCDRHQRDTAYDDVHHGKPESVYSPQCIIRITREVAACHGCGKVTEIINHYCEVCRGNGANEKQCADPRSIR